MDSRTEDVFPSPIEYLFAFYQHVQDTRNHFSGSDHSKPLEPSEFGLSCWTAEEKNILFHGLSVYSRLRPDLIAADIGTKNVAEVTAYIDALEDAITSETVSRPHFTVSYTDGGSRDWRKIQPTSRDSFPIAMEMSERWCQMEDSQSTLLASHEPALLARATERSHDAILETRRQEIRMTRGSAKSDEGVRDRKGEKERRKEFEAWAEARREEWKVDDFKSCLDAERLAALDSVLREAEEERHARSLQDEASKGTASRRSSTPLPESTTNTLAASSSAGATLPDNNHDVAFSLLSESTSQPGPSRQSTPPNPDPHDGEDPAAESAENLSPTSRRRLYKRMYMRRKRAEKAGLTVDQTSARLKPGRKAKSALQGDTAGSAPARRHPHKSGLTQTYKTRANVDVLGLDAERIQREGFDLFRLANFHKLMRSYNELHGVDPLIVSSISSEVLATLQTHVIHFVRTIAKKAFLSRSFERQTKARTKVWRISTRPIVRTRNVKHALGMCVGKLLSKKRHFRQLRKSVLLEKVTQPVANSDAGNSDDENEEHEEEVEVARLGPTFRNSQDNSLTFERKVDFTKKRMLLPIRHLSTARTVRPPDINPPCEWEADVPLPRQATLNSRRELHCSTPWGAPERARDDACIDSETDEEAFAAEMESEDELDEWDVEAQEEYEEELWMGGKKRHGTTRSRRLLGLERISKRSAQMDVESEDVEEDELDPEPDEVEAGAEDDNGGDDATSQAGGQGPPLEAEGGAADEEMEAGVEYEASAGRGKKRKRQSGAAAREGADAQQESSQAKRVKVDRRRKVYKSKEYISDSD